MGHILPFPPGTALAELVEALDLAAALVLTACIRPWVAAARKEDLMLPLMAAMEEALAPAAAACRFMR